MTQAYFNFVRYCPDKHTKSVANNMKIALGHILHHKTIKAQQGIHRPLLSIVSTKYLRIAERARLPLICDENSDVDKATGALI